MYKQINCFTKGDHFYLFLKSIIYGAVSVSNISRLLVNSALLWKIYIYTLAETSDKASDSHCHRQSLIILT